MTGICGLIGERSTRAFLYSRNTRSTTLRIRSNQAVSVLIRTSRKARRAKTAEGHTKSKTHSFHIRSFRRGRGHKPTATTTNKQDKKGKQKKMSTKHDDPPAYNNNDNNNPAYPQPAYQQHQQQGGAAAGYYQQQPPMGYGQAPYGPPPAAGGYYYPPQQQQGPYQGPGPYPPAGYYQPAPYGPPQQREKSGPGFFEACLAGMACCCSRRGWSPGTNTDTRVGGKWGEKTAFPVSMVNSARHCSPETPMAGQEDGCCADINTGSNRGQGESVRLIQTRALVVFCVCLDFFFHFRAGLLGFVII
ncbi:hypothetical protein VTH06DRAFT_3022 [Thermothelomyces fergusii]